jgi:hypothetical protein
MRHCVIAVVAGVLLCASHASAQSAPPPSATAQSAAAQASAEAWQFEVVPYLWGSGINGPVGIRNRTVDVDASFDNILRHLHFAAMGLADARRDRLVVLGDVIYTDLRGHRATPGPLFSGVEPQQRLFILTPEAGYRVLGNEEASVDVLGGIRYWHLKSELQFQAGLLPGVDLEASRGWVDGIAGLRARMPLSSRWSVSAYGDVGAGGSKLTYQIVGNASLDFHDRYGVDFAYRYLSVDYDNDGFLFDTAMQGPLLGFSIRF